MPLTFFASTTFKTYLPLDLRCLITCMWLKKSFSSLFLLIRKSSLTHSGPKDQKLILVLNKLLKLSQIVTVYFCFGEIFNKFGFIFPKSFYSLSCYSLQNIFLRMPIKQLVFLCNISFNKNCFSFFFLQIFLVILLFLYR